MDTETIRQMLQSWRFEQDVAAYRSYARLPSWKAYVVTDLEFRDGSDEDRPGERSVRLVGTVAEAHGYSEYDHGVTCVVRFVDSAHSSHVSWGVDCDCDKPVCIHSYFLLVEARKYLAADTVPPALVSWAAKLQRAELHPSGKPVGELAVGVLLHPEFGGAAGTGAAAISTVILGEPKSLASRKPQQISRGQPGILSSLKPGEASRLAMMELTAYTNHQVGMSGSGFKTITTADQESTFEEILEDGRVYLDRLVGQPLRRGADVEPVAGWVSAGNQRQKLQLLFPDQTSVKLALRLHSLWYCQDEVMGRLLGDPEFMSTIMQAPPLHDLQLPAVIDFWAKQPFAQRIPAPLSTATIREIKVKPKGVLRLRFSTVKGEDGGSDRKIPVAHLTYSYDGWEVNRRLFDSGGVALRRSGSETVRILMDEATQAALYSGLLSCGFQFYKDAAAVRYRFSPHDMAFVNAAFHAELEDIEHFGRAIDRCEAGGYQIVFEDAFPFRNVDSAPGYTALTSEAGADGGSSRWFELEMGIEVDGKRHNLGAVVSSALRDPLFKLKAPSGEPVDARWTVKLDDGQLVRVPLSDLRKLVAPIAEWMDGETKLKDGKVRLGKLQAAMAAVDLAAEAPRALSNLRKGISRLREIAKAPLPKTSSGFMGELRPYQREGLRWLNGLAEAGLGGILADDMGLGKTLEVLAHVLHLKDKGKLPNPVLVVVPKSLVTNWFNEARKFAPTLRVLTLQGQGRASNYQSIQDHDLVVTTYNVLPRDIRLIEDQTFSLIIVDESQALKNPKVLAGKALRRLTTEATICLTGTPVENHLLDLWSQMDLALPGLLGEQREFKRLFGTPIEKHGDVEKQARLNKRVHPFILRRTKAEVILDLPPKTEAAISVELEGDQRLLYESLRAAMNAEVQQAIAERGIANSGIIILGALLKLRQACCHPQLVDLESAKAIDGSAKLDVLMEMLREATAEGRRVLVFSSFTSMLALIAKALDAEVIQYLSLTGKTENRAALVDLFQTGAIPIFLISLKAGGVGLNLTAADTVIHFDPWWNPAAENQATDRAHRIGQTKPIMVYRLICENSVESKIQALQKRKGALADSILDNASTSLTDLTEEDIAELLSNGP